jgi:Zn-finger nucleic acid-binding protein
MANYDKTICPICGVVYATGLYDFDFIHCNCGCGCWMDKKTGNLLLKQENLDVLLKEIKRLKSQKKG